MIPRLAAPRLIELAGYYPVVAITGPRQSGKTTLARATFPDKPYASLEDPDVRDLDHVHRFVLMSAARSGQLVKLSALAADCGITHNTAHAWIGVLEASYIATRLTPFHRNFGKRLTKTPKLYLLDSGLAAWLAGVRSAPELVVGSLRGPLFETRVVSELLKRRRNGLCSEEFHFWRDSAGNEVDLLITRGEEVVAATACKSGRTVAGDWFEPLERFAALAGSPRRLLISGGDADQPRTDGPVFGWRTSAAPWISRSPHLPVPMKGRHPQGAPLARHAHFSACTVDAPDRRHESMWVKSTRIRMGHRVIDMEQYMRLR